MTYNTLCLGCQANVWEGWFTCSSCGVFPFCDACLKTHEATCPTTGSVELDHDATCPRCGGSGRVTVEYVKTGVG